MINFVAMPVNIYQPGPAWTVKTQSDAPVFQRGQDLWRAGDLASLRALWEAGDRAADDPAERPRIRLLTSAHGSPTRAALEDTDATLEELLASDLAQLADRLDGPDVMKC